MPQTTWTTRTLLLHLLPGAITLLAAGQPLQISLAPAPLRSTNATSSWLWKKYVTHLHGYSTDPALLAKVQQAVDAARGQPVLVILDSDHTSGHVANEAQLYCPFATQGSYCIVQDTKISRWALLAQPALALALLLLVTLGWGCGSCAFGSAQPHAPKQRS